jgi:hypothetical protein
MPRVVRGSGRPRSPLSRFEGLVLAGCERFEPLIRIATKPADGVVKIVRCAKLNT